MLQPGFPVSWWVPKPRHQGHIQKNGVILSYVPKGISIRSIVEEAHPDIPPDAIRATDVSKKDRYLVKVEKAVHLPGFRSYEVLAPEAMKLERSF